MTGPAAIRWAVANPGRDPRPCAAQFVLGLELGTHAARAQGLARTNRRRRAAARHGRDAVGAVRHLFRWQIGRIWGTHTPLSDELTRTFCKTFAASPVARQALHRINKGLPAQINANQRRLDVPAQLQCRTLILWGGRDPYLRSHVARQFHRLIPNSELHLFHDAGHFVQVEAAVEAARAINAFIEGCRTEA